MLSTGTPRKDRGYPPRHASSRHEIVVFSDANNLYAKDAIRQIVKPFSNPTIGGASGSKHIIKGDSSLGETDSLYWKYESYIKVMETHLGCCVGSRRGGACNTAQLIYSTARNTLLTMTFLSLWISSEKGIELFTSLKRAHTKERRRAKR